MNKKFVLLCLIAIFTVFCNCEAFAYKIQAGAQTKRIPRGTVIQLKMEEPVTTENMQLGEMFSASITNDVLQYDEVVLPTGTLVRGSIKEIKPAKRLSKAAILYLNFDHVVTTSGRQLPIKAGLCSNFKLTDDGAITNGGNYGFALAQNWHKTVDIVKNTTLWGVKSGEELFNGGRFLITPFSAVGGVIAGGAYYVYQDIADLFRKGDDVVINQGKIFSILLLDNLDVPSY